MTASLERGSEAELGWGTGIPWVSELRKGREKRTEDTTELMFD